MRILPTPTGICSVLAVLTFFSAAPEATAADSSAADTREIYELRIYRNDSAEKRAAVLSYLRSALIPALNRQGVARVGVFVPTENTKDGRSEGDVYVLVPFADETAWIQSSEQLEADDAYRNAADEFLNASKDAPAYSRCDVRVMRAFRGMPKHEAPAADSDQRIVELRIYESHNDEKARLKIAMFDEGEIDLMKNVDMAPVFFARSLSGDDLPNLVYMLSAAGPEDHQEHWQRFLRHPDWDAMKNLERFRGTVSRITSVTLSPAEGSQL